MSEPTPSPTPESEPAPPPGGRRNQSPSRRTLTKFELKHFSRDHLRHDNKMAHIGPPPHGRDLFPSRYPTAAEVSRKTASRRLTAHQRMLDEVVDDVSSDAGDRAEPRPTEELVRSSGWRAGGDPSLPSPCQLSLTS